MALIHRLLARGLSHKIAAVLADAIDPKLGVVTFSSTITLSTSAATTATGLTPDGLVLSVAARVAAEIEGLDSADHHLRVGVAGTTDKYVDVANGSAATSIAENVKDHYVGDPVHEAAELVLTLTGGSDNTPSAGAVELEVVYLPRADLADG